MRERNHFYLYTVAVRHVEVTPNGKVISWRTEHVNACNMHEVAGKLNQELVDLRYISKEIQR